MADGPLGTADAPGAPGVRVEVAAVVGLQSAPCFPCGACRQVLHGFGCMRVVVETGAYQVRSLPLSGLLPHTFGPGDL